MNISPYRLLSLNCLRTSFCYPKHWRYLSSDCACFAAFFPNLAVFWLYTECSLRPCHFHQLWENENGFLKWVEANYSGGQSLFTDLTTVLQSVLVLLLSKANSTNNQTPLNYDPIGYYWFICTLHAMNTFWSDDFILKCVFNEMMLN